MRCAGVRLWNSLRGVGYKSAVPAPPAGAGASPSLYFEWSMGPANAAVSDQRLAQGWAAFLEALGPLDNFE